MCESTQIRYVHVMEHPDYPEMLGVGCVCAEHMEQDYVRPRLREQNLRSKSQRRKTWIRRNWRTSAKGNANLVKRKETADRSGHIRQAGVIGNREAEDASLSQRRSPSFTAPFGFGR
jgi:hypothetical protein